MQFALLPDPEVFLPRKEGGPNADLPCINGGGDGGWEGGVRNAEVGELRQIRV